MSSHEKRETLRRPTIVDVKSSEHASAGDWPGRVGVDCSAGWRALPERLMWPALVEVVPVLPKQRAEMLIVENKDVVERLASYAAHEALRDRVHVRCSHCDLDDARAGAFATWSKLGPNL